MTEIKDLEDEVILVKNAIDNNKLEIIKSSTNNIIFYYSVFSDEALTPSNYPVKFDKLFAFFEFVVQDSDFDLLGLSQFADFPTENFVEKNLIKL